ncbi:hypothetical protein ACO34A_02245 [Rhizobium sp. ACO-34A]|nr:HEPN domain-containing protein [Rhizobium sp. ACO-34A]ATN32624.1 hypothetical protein ACO34A_02245 [Rhizobium sp. ACO-34A]
MPGASMVQRLLQSADDLIRQKPNSAAYRRRAVSAAYYAAFHALAALCVKSLLPKPRSDDEVLRVYRALDHGQLRNAFLQQPLKEHERFKDIASLIVKLQQERHRADYLPPDSALFPENEVRDLLDQARVAVDLIDGLNEADSRLLATSLLFKERKS